MANVKGWDIFGLAYAMLKNNCTEPHIWYKQENYIRKYHIFHTVRRVPVLR